MEYSSSLSGALPCEIKNRNKLYLNFIKGTINAIIGGIAL
jgi:hypothetical protein